MTQNNKKKYQENRRQSFILTIEIPCYGYDAKGTEKEVMTDLKNQYKMLDFYSKGIRKT